MKFHKIIIITQVAILAALSESSAQFEGAQWDTLTSDNTRDALSRQPLAATPGGLHLTYGKSRGSGNGWSIYYRFFGLVGGWDNDVIVSSGLNAYSPSIAAREFDAFKIAVFFDADDDIYGAIVNSPWDSWEPVQYIVSVDEDREPSAAIDENGIVHVAWIMDVVGDYRIVWGQIIEDTLAYEIIYDSDLGQYGWGAVPRLVTLDGLPHIFYRGIEGGNYHIHHAYKIDPNSDWEIEPLYSGNIDDYLGSPAVDDNGTIHLAMSGNDGWGLPGKIYYRSRDYETGNWINAELATESFSVTEGSIDVSNDGDIYIVSSGVSGNIYTGEIFLTINEEGVFQTDFLTYYQDGTNPSLALLAESMGAMVMQGIVGEYNSDNFEIIYYGPTRTDIYDRGIIPEEIIVYPNYPNPFNASTEIRFSLPMNSHVYLDIYNLLGQKAATLLKGDVESGEYSITWDAGDLPSGVYYAVLKTAGRSESIKMVLLK